VIRIASKILAVVDSAQFVGRSASEGRRGRTELGQPVVPEGVDGVPCLTDDLLQGAAHGSASSWIRPSEFKNFLASFIWVVVTVQPCFGVIWTSSSTLVATPSPKR
jgi:hypothetical protein